MLLNATMVGDNRGEGVGVASANATWRSPFVTLTGGLCTGDPGRVKAAAVVQPVRGVLGYATLQLVLDQTAATSQHGLTAGVGIDKPALTGYVQTVVRSPEDVGKSFQARAIVRSGALQFAAECAVAVVAGSHCPAGSRFPAGAGPHLPGSTRAHNTAAAAATAEPLFVTPATAGQGSYGGYGGNSGGGYGDATRLGGGLDAGELCSSGPAIEVGNLALTNVKLRVVYSNTGHTASGQPHSYQLGLAVEDGGRVVIGRVGLVCEWLPANTASNAV
jgi:hypothetical protein